MKVNGLIPWPALLQRWRRLSLRERGLLLMSGAFVFGVAAFSLVWQPTQQRLATAERQYHQQLALAAQLQLARPRSAREPVAQPLSLYVSESATEATNSLANGGERTRRNALAIETRCPASSRS